MIGLASPGAASPSIASADTPTLAAAAGFVAVAGMALLVGRLVERLAAGSEDDAMDSGFPGGAAWRTDGRLIAGLVTIHLLLLALDLAGVPWSRPVLGLAGVAILAAGVWLAVRQRGGERVSPSRAPRPPDRRRPSPPWGAGLAAVAVAIYGAFAWSLRATTPDFVYHWGSKGRRYHLAHGVDWSFLSDPLRLTDHPDYPNLLPDLYAAAAVVAGGFEARAAMLWSVLFLALLPLAARRAWRRWDLGGWKLELGTVTVTAAAVFFALGYRLAGGGDGAIALAVVAAAPSLAARRPTATDDLALGLAAALAAGAKIEGVPLAGFLVTVHLGRRLARRRRELGGGEGSLPALLLRCGLPPLLVVLPWVAQCLRYGLFSASNPTRLDLARLGEVLPALVEALGTREWHGLAWLVVLALPALLLAHRTRALALVCALQLAFYGWVYLSSPLEPTFYVLSSFPRLLYHVAPAVLTGLITLLAGSPKHRRPPETDRLREAG